MSPLLSLLRIKACMRKEIFMKNIVLSPNPYRDRNFRHVLDAERVLKSVGVETAICLSFDVDRNFDLPKDVQLSPMEESLEAADALICFGGDGTILHASKAASARGVPVLGVNIGTVGFMAELESGEMQLLSKLADDNYTLDERMMLSVRLFHEGQQIFQDVALNDILITKGAVARVISVTVRCDGREAMSFSGDGVIIATPTGSTAYSMSAGGPIVEPKAENILITPICAHDIQPRCLVTAPSRVIEIEVGRINRRNAFLSADGGKAIRVYSGDRIVIERAPMKTKLIKLKDHSYFDTVKTKLNR